MDGAGGVRLKKMLVFCGGVGEESQSGAEEKLARGDWALGS